MQIQVGRLDPRSFKNGGMGTIRPKKSFTDSKQDYLPGAQEGMGEWIMGILIGDYIETTIGIYSPIPS